MVIIKRRQEIENIKWLMKSFPVTAILGPRQCGKTFLARQIKADYYYDLENSRDLSAFDEPQLLLEKLSGTIIIDEIQRRPDLFTTLRFLVDNYPAQKYLILGSASGVLLRQSSESLAGRIGYCYLSGFSLADVGAANMQKLWMRGGFPRSFLASSGRMSREWLDNYITTFLEKDIPQIGITIPARTLRNFWLMLSHYHGQVINFSEIGRSFGISDMTVRKYIDILESMFMVRILQPWHNNTNKRLIKSPKIYLRDSGILHRLFAIEEVRGLFVHPKIGASWEGFALECVMQNLKLKPQEIFFWGTYRGAKLDLFWQARGKKWGVEFKYGDAPKVTKSMQSACSDLGLSHLWVIYPGDKEYKMSSLITALPLRNLAVRQSAALKYNL